ncbi:MAG: hypothetical protein WB341_09340 [Terracidiphilus sp.]
MNLTPTTKGAFLAGVLLWCLMWLSLFKADDIAELGGIQRWMSSERVLRWIREHKSTTLLSTELINYGTHGIGDAESVTFAAGGTLVNALVIYVLLPLLSKVARDNRARKLQL